MSKIRVGLFGFGKTGSHVAQEILRDPELELRWVCRKNPSVNLSFASHALGFDDNFAPFVLSNEISSEFLESNPVDVVIDFSAASSVENYERVAKSGAKIVSAISKYSRVEKDLIKKSALHTAALQSPNITLGINWVIMASKILKSIIPQADIEIVEEHFRKKSEVSGTALRLAEHLHLDPNEHINSIRVGGIVGKHEVIFGLPYQTIRLTHESISRAAFATGAIFAVK